MGVNDYVKYWSELSVEEKNSEVKGLVQVKLKREEAFIKPRHTWT